MPPGSPMRCRVCRLATCTPWTMTRDSSGNTRNTSPVRPLSRPAITTTLSPRLIFNFGMFPLQPLRSQYLRRQRHDLHEAPRAQLAGHRTKDAGSNRLALIGDQHRRVAVEADCAAVDAADFLCRAHDDRAMHIAFLDPAARDRLFDRHDDDVADRRSLALRATQHLDALQSASAGVIGDVE